MASTDTTPDMSEHEISADNNKRDDDTSGQLHGAVARQNSQAESQTNDATASTHDEPASTSDALRAPVLPMRSPKRASISDTNAIPTRPHRSRSAEPSTRNTRFDDPPLVGRDLATVPPAFEQKHRSREIVRRENKTAAASVTRDGSNRRAFDAEKAVGRGYGKDPRVEDGAPPVPKVVHPVSAHGKHHSGTSNRPSITTMQAGRANSFWSDPPASIHSAPGALHGTDATSSPMPIPVSVTTPHVSRKRKRKPFSSTYRWPSPVPEEPPIHLAFSVRTPTAGPYIEPPPPKWYDPVLQISTKQWWHDKVWYNLTCRGCFEDQGCFAEGGCYANWDWTCFLACCCPLRKWTFLLPFPRDGMSKSTC